MLAPFWKRLKRWRKLKAGPVTLHFGLRRSVRVRHSKHHRLDDAGGTARPCGRSLSEALFRQQTTPESLAGVAVIVGVGPGLGQTLAVRLAEAGMTVVLVSRDAEKHDALVAEIRNMGGVAFSHACDATDERSMEQLLARVTETLNVPALVVYSLQWFARTPSLEVSVPEFEDSWRHNCLGPFLLAREAGKAMATVGRGTIVLIGSTSSVVGRAEHLSFAVGKFGMRALAHVLARELWPRGIHVAHLLIDADIREGSPADYPQSDPAHIAESIEFLHRQPRTAWTSEMDLRPWGERFWEHC
jgi:NAD(P)-dependent dehydrogenase (short-subunit alcohol dehydrogenase family)